MQNGWITKPLREVTNKIGSGATPLGGHASYKSEGIKLIRSMNVHDARFKPDNLASIDEVQAEALSHVAVEEGDVLLNITGASIARCCRAPKECLPARVNQHVAIIRPRPDTLDSDFLAYLLISKQYKDALLKIGDQAGATRQALTKAQLQDFKLAFPPSISDQQRIVAILDEVFEDIDKAIAHTEKNLVNARELFLSRLTSLIQQHDAAVQQHYLMDVCLEFGRGKSKHRPRNDPKLYGGPHPFIQTGDLSGREHFVKSYSQTYSDDGLAQSKLWPKGTVCIAIVGATIGESGILEFDACFPDSVIGMIADPEKSSPEYIQYVLQAYKALLKSKGEGSARDNINLGTFEQQQFPFPSLLRQKEIVASLHYSAEATDRLHGIADQKRHALNELKQSLLLRAFSGQLLTIESLVEAAE
jgi:type I restriction enzyme, S subunit